jgi:hypothetical protein
LFVRKRDKVDAADAFDWYEGHHPGLGGEFAGELAQVYAAIETQPQRFPVVLDDIRMALLRRFPYVVHFVVLSKHTSVIAVMHGHRNPKVWQQRR